MAGRMTKALASGWLAVRSSRDQLQPRAEARRNGKAVAESWRVSGLLRRRVALALTGFPEEGADPGGAVPQPRRGDALPGNDGGGCDRRGEDADRGGGGRGPEGPAETYYVAPVKAWLHLWCQRFSAMGSASSGRFARRSALVAMLYVCRWTGSCRPSAPHRRSQPRRRRWSQAGSRVEMWVEPTELVDEDRSLRCRREVEPVIER